jgi:hypothetical protein
MMKGKVFAVALAAFVGTSWAYAAEATGRFTGKVTSTGANAVTISEVYVGDEVAGTFTFSTDAADQVSQDPTTGRYEAESMSLSLRGFEFSAPSGTIDVSNDRVLVSGQPAQDAFEVVSPLQVVTGPSLSGLTPTQIDLVLVDTDAAAFSDDSLPASINLADFEIVSEVPYGTTGGRLIFQSSANGGIGEVRFEITSLSIDIEGVSSGDVIVYPQLAVGGGYEVVLMVTNRSGSYWSGRAEPLLDDGSLDALKTRINLGPRETRKYTLTGGSEAIATGLVIAADPGSSVTALSVAYFFNFLSQGKLLDSTGVPKGESAGRFAFPVERTDSVNTGLAIRRLPSQPDAPITLTLYGSDGAQLLETSSESNFAKFFNELFAAVPSDFVGSVVAESTEDFYLVVLRFETTGSGFQLTSVPAGAE